MAYRFALEKTDYTDYARGRVFYSMPGQPAFPIRLTREIFQRCLAARAALGASGPAAIYDPCGGGAYHLSTLAYLHWDQIRSITVSDVDPLALDIARQNLSLLTLAGMDKRRSALEALQARYGKEAHAEALDSAARLAELLQKNLARHSIPTHLFAANATQPAALAAGLSDQTIDIIITDLPYGQLSNWEQQAAGHTDPITAMLAALRPHLTTTTIAAVAGTKTQKAAHPDYQQVGRFKIGKRQITMLQPA